jgi:four helix bundle protein
MIRSYRDLIAWQRAMDLAQLAYRITGGYPPREQFGLAGQTRRAAVSVPSNIAEGTRHGRAAYRARIRVALGEHAELETQIELARRLGYLSPRCVQEFDELSAEVGRLVHGLLRSLT